MQELEKILEEIDAHAIEFEAFGISDDYISVGWVKEIIRKHMNDGWISVEERLPYIGQRVIATIKHHAWITDYDSDWVPESEKSRNQEYTESCEAVMGEDGSWTYRCKEDDYTEDTAYINPKKDISKPISEVIAWQPMPETYRPERSVGE